MTETSKLKQAFASGKFVVSGEIGPPKGTNIHEMLQHIDLLKDRVDALNVTDNQTRASARLTRIRTAPGPSSTSAWKSLARLTISGRYSRPRIIMRKRTRHG